MHAAKATSSCQLGSGAQLSARLYFLCVRELQHLGSVVQRSSQACRPHGRLAAGHRLNGIDVQTPSPQQAGPTPSAAVASTNGWQNAAGQQQPPGTPQVHSGECALEQAPRGSNEQAAGLTTWQQRQQHQRKSHRQRQQWQQRRQSAASRPTQKQAFADCSSYQCLCGAVQHLQQSQARKHAAESRQPAQEQPIQWQPLLTAAECVSLIDQLAIINRATSGGGSSEVGSSNNFVEDQALLQILPLAYDTLDHYTSPHPVAATASPSSPPAHHPARRQNSPSSAATTTLRPIDLLRCISNLAALKYNQPSRLAALLELRSAGKMGLSGLKMQQLSALVAGLAKAGVKSSNVWLVALMQEAERRLPAAKLPHLSQLLHGLVRMGVKPAASWLDCLQDQAVQCLIEQAVQCQVSEDHIQQQQQALQEQETPVAAATAIQRSTSSRLSKQQASCQLRDTAQLLTAFAEAKHTPKPQLSAALWGATAASLAVADLAGLVGILSAIGELQLVPPASWMQQYYSSTAVQLQERGQYKPWQLAESVKALGRLAKAGLQCSSSSGKQQPQQEAPGDTSASVADPAAPVQHKGSTASDGISCGQWVAAVLSVAQQQLSSFAARDIAALLSGLAELHLPLNSQQLQPLLAEAQQKLPRLNTAGLTLLAKAAVQLEQQQRGLKQSDQQQQAVEPQQKQQPVLLTQDWVALLLQEAAAKLPMFPADDLAELLIVLAGSKLAAPSRIWLEAAAVQLQSKLTVLEPGVLVQVLAAFTALGHKPDQHWLSSALAAVEARVVELQFADLAQLLEIVVGLQDQPERSFIAAARWAVQQQQITGLQGQQRRQVLTGVIPFAVDAGDMSADCESVCERLLQQLE